MERIRNAVLILASIIAVIRTHAFVAGTGSPNVPSLGAGVSTFSRFTADPGVRAAFFWYVMTLLMLAVVAGLAWFITREIASSRRAAQPSPPAWARRRRTGRAQRPALAVIRNRD